MKTKILTLVSVAALTMSLASSVYAGSSILSDDALDTVSAKSNESFTGAADSTTVNGSVGMAGNVQVGYYQWDDIHSTDQSINKGGNIQSGDQSEVQMNATIEANCVAWGGCSDSITTNTRSPIGGTQGAESWWIMYVGGF